MQPSNISVSQTCYPEISVCLCTYKRPAMLANCLESLSNQSTTHSYEVIVVDNDTAGTAKSTIEQFRTAFRTRGCNLRYDVEPKQNIALARNKAVSVATGKYIAFIDDDEEAERDWLDRLVDTLILKESDAVFGRVVRAFPEGFPESLRRANIFEDHRMRESGSRIAGTGGRTSNGIVRSSVLKMRPGPFDKELGKTGGEDTEFFCWLEQKGCTFSWCSEAVVNESITLERARLRYHFRRGYSTGWVRARIALSSRRRIQSVMRVLIGALLGSAKTIVMFLISLPNPRVATVRLVRGMGSQAGKCGFLLGICVEQYRG